VSNFFEVDHLHSRKAEEELLLLLYKIENSFGKKTALKSRCVWLAFAFSKIKAGSKQNQTHSTYSWLEVASW
jgi:hypothetical protein